MSRISVIIPVYNVEDYLDWCLQSLYDQTLKDIEIVCVNDGSTDSSRQKLDEWAARDSRIVIVDKPNGGLSSARNAGIRAAGSPYVCFLDSDDRFHLDACEAIVGIFDSTDADVVTFGACCYPKEAGYPWLENALSPRDVVYETFSLDLLFKENSRPFSWRTACRRDLLLQKEIFFDETIRFGEDQVFDFALYPRAGKTVLSSKKLYDYRVSRAGSLMDRISGDIALKMGEHVKIADRILDDWRRGGFLDAYGVQMVSFVLDFSFYDALKLPDAGFAKIADALSGVLSKYWSTEQLGAMGLNNVDSKMVSAAFAPSSMGTLARKKVALDHYTQLYGRRAAAHRLIEVLFH